MEQGVWQEIELLYQKFQKLGISEAVDYDKYYLYSLITAQRKFLVGIPTNKYLCLPLYYETRTTSSSHPSRCAYRQL